MNNKTKKIIAIVVPIVLILLIVLAIVLVVVLHKDDGGDNNPPAGHDQHTAFKYEDESDTQHKVICEECDYVELADHEYVNDQAANCKYCTHIRTIEYPGELTTPTGVKLSADKTDLKAGDTFTLTIEISSTRKDMFWHSIDVAFGPVNSEGKKPSTDISPYFEVVSKTTSVDKYIGVKDEVYGVPLIEDNSYDNFQDVESETLTNLGFKLSLGFIGKEISTSESIIVTVKLKVKDNAPDIPNFAFGVAPLNKNIVACNDAEDSVLIQDLFDQSTVTSNADGKTKEKGVNCITCNSLIMSIISKEN